MAMWSTQPDARRDRVDAGGMVFQVEPLTLKYIIYRKVINRKKNGNKSHHNIWLSMLIQLIWLSKQSLCRRCDCRLLALLDMLMLVLDMLRLGLHMLKLVLDLLLVHRDNLRNFGLRFSLYWRDQILGLNDKNM